MEIDKNGNYIYLDIELQSFSLRLINIYAPNNDTPSFFDHLQNIVQENEQNYVAICGDFNLVLDFEMDCDKYININNPRSRQTLLNTMGSCKLKDVFRFLYPNLRRYTWRHKHPIKQARLDYFIVNEPLLDIITTCKINPGYRSDHSSLQLNILINSFQQGKGIWKLNCELLQNLDYIRTVNQTIQELRSRYSIPVYAQDYINEANDLDLTVYNRY